MDHKIIGTPMQLPNGNTLPLSRAVKAGDFLFLSGQLGVDDNFNLADGIFEQTRLCINNMLGILETASMNLDNVIKTTVWLTNVNDFADFNQVYAELFPQNTPPARSTVCSALAIPGALVEIEAIAFSKD